MDFIVSNLSHLSFALVAVSFAVRDMYRLRCLSIAANLILIAFEVLNYKLGMVHEIRVATVAWNSLFIAINGFRLATMIHGERSAKFTADEKLLYDTLFRNFTKLEFMKLLSTGRWLAAEPGAVLATQGSAVADLMLIYSGVAAVEAGGTPIAQLRDGQFIGEMSFLTGDPASATVTITEPTRYLAWRKDDLQKLLSRNPTLRFGLTSVMGVDMTRKLRHPSGGARRDG